MTDLVQTEEALRRSEEKFRQLAVMLPDTISFQDSQLRYGWIVNPPSSLDEEQLLGKTDHDLFPREEADKLTEIKARVLQSGEELRAELQLSPAGITRWYGIACKPWRNPEGRIVGIVCHSRDIGQQLRARRETELEGIIESTQAQLALLDRDLNFLMVNSAYEKGSGYRAEELIGRNHFSLFPNDENQAIFERVRDTGISYEAIEKPFEYAGQPERGVTYWNWILAPIKDASGRVVEVLLSLLDVTPQVQARARYEQQAAQMSALLRGLDDAVTILDASGRIVLRNEAMARLTGAHHGDAQSLDDFDSNRRILALDGSPLPKEQHPAYRMLRGEKVDGEETLVERPDGSRRQVAWSNSSLVDERGKVEMAILIGRDVTELRQLEQLREDYLRAVSHDLRNPLTSILGHAQLIKRVLEKTGVTGIAPKSAESIATTAQRMNSMIQDLADAARLESGQVRLELSPVDLPTFVLNLRERMDEPGDADRIEVEAPSGLPWVRADLSHLERILRNLLSNALKYSPSDQMVTVTISEQDGQVVTSVSDRGIGMSPEELSRLFERYYRTGKARASGGGLGLGLYITRGLVKANGGRIWVESKEGKGSTFTFTLPVATR